MAALVPGQFGFLVGGRYVGHGVVCIGIDDQGGEAADNLLSAGDGPPFEFRDPLPDVLQDA